MKGGVRQKTPGGNWYYYFDAGKIDGKRNKLERVGGRTKKEAQDALRKALNEFEKCGSVVGESKMSVSDYFNYWHKEYVMINCKYNTQDYYRRIIDNHIKPALGVYHLKSLTPAVLQEFINNKYKNGFSKSSLSNFMGVLSKALKMAVYPYQLIKDNPMQYVSMPKFNGKKQETQVLTVEQYNTIIKRFDEKSNFYIPLQIAFHTGMRAAEVCGLTWDCVDLEKNIIKVEKILIYQDKEWVFGTPKTDSSEREILIGKTLSDILKKHKKSQLENKLRYGKYYTDSDFVCTKENGELITMNSLKYLSRVVNYELKIPFTFHALRHTHATLLLEQGANIKDIQKRLGHNKLDTTADTYSHVTKKMNRDTVDIFEKLISYS